MKKRVISVEKVRSLLPHGEDSFLYLPDHIENIELYETADEKLAIQAMFYPPAEHFKGHFPGKPVYPGVIQLEALMQLGAILALADENQSRIVYPTGMEKVKFHKAIDPDTRPVCLDMCQIQISKRGGKGFGKVLIDSSSVPATEATFSFLFGS